MITVNILINGEAIFTRSAHRRTAKHQKDGKDCYLVDDGQLIYHDVDDGAVELAHKLLNTIVEDDENTVAQTVKRLKKK